MKALLSDAAEMAERYTSSIAGRRVAPLPEDVDRLRVLGGPLPENSSNPSSVLAMLDDFGSQRMFLSSPNPVSLQDAPQ
jgi:hypothetical protein